jgi:S-adenosylmethionine decarboxylase
MVESFNGKMHEDKLQLLEIAEGDRASIAVGVHCILELYDCPAELLNNITFIEEALHSAAIEAESRLLGELSHQFMPQGVTALLLLAQSHLSIHTWPESGYAAVDLFTCGENTKPQKACQYLIQKLEAKDFSLVEIPRKKML